MEWLSCPETPKESTGEAVETSNGAVSAYSYTLALLLPTTNILAPSFENATPTRARTCSETSKEAVKE